MLPVPPGSQDIRRRLREKAQRTYVIPGTRRTRVAVETMRDWLSLYRTGGFEALYPKPRSDRGQPRRLPPEVAEALVSLNTEQPALSVKALINAARARSVDHPLAPSTVHRLLSREGLLDKRPGEPAPTDRRRFAYRDAGELWMSDVLHGPKVSVYIPAIPITRSGVIPITDSTVSDHQSERSDAGVALWGEVIGLVQRCVCLSHGVSFEVELVGVVDEPVEDGVGEGGVSDHGMPVLHGQLRSHNRGA